MAPEHQRLHLGHRLLGVAPGAVAILLRRKIGLQDTRTGVAMLEYRYDVPFKFTGKIDKLTFNLEPEPKEAPRSITELRPIAAPDPDPIEESKP
jgi:hypothetical protein